MPHPATAPVYRIGILLLLWCTGLYLRIPMLVAPALAPWIGEELQLGPTAAGALTTLPVLMLALGALAGSVAIARLGARRALIAGLAVAVAASAARGLAPPTSLLFLATGIMGLGIAVMQPALPALVGLWCPGFAALAVTVYMNGMLMGEFLGAGLTLPVLMPLTGGSWRLALLLWSLPALLVVAGLLLPRAAEPGTGKPAGMPDWRDGRMWRLGLLLGAASVLYFGTNAYMADILKGRGESGTLDHALLWFNLSQGIASFGMILLARHLVMRRLPIIVTSLAGPACALLFLSVGGNFGLAAAFVLGAASAVQLILLVAAAPYLAASGEAGRLSAGMFAIGYAVAFTVPLLGGLVANATEAGWTALIPILLYASATVPLALTLRLRGSDRRNDAAGK